MRLFFQTSGLHESLSNRAQPECSQTSADNQITLTPDQINHSLSRLELFISDQHCHLTLLPELTWTIHVANLDVFIMTFRVVAIAVLGKGSHLSANAAATCVLQGLMLTLSLSLVTPHRMLLGSSGLCSRSLWGSDGRPWPTGCSPSVRWLTSGCGASPTLSVSSPAWATLYWTAWRRRGSLWTSWRKWGRMRSVKTTEI